jgi:DNA-binding MarR family transcriptional regulator
LEIEGSRGSMEMIKNKKMIIMVVLTTVICSVTIVLSGAIKNYKSQNVTYIQTYDEPWTPVVGDIDSDGIPEVVIGSGDTLSIYKVVENNPELVWYKKFDKRVHTPAIGDLARYLVPKVIPEIVVFVSDETGGTLYAIEPDQSILWSTEIRSSIKGKTSCAPAIGKINEDHDKDVVILFPDGKLRVFDGGDGSVVWAKDLGYGSNGVYDGKVAIVDLDYDYMQEIVCSVYTDTEDDGIIYILDKNGDVSWQCEGKDFAIADIQLDELPEIVTITSNKIHVHDMYGKLLWHKYVTDTKLIGIGIADLTSDFRPEIIVGHRYGVTTYYNDGTLFWTSKTSVEYTSRSLAISDLNRDNVPDIITVSTNGAAITDGNTGDIITKSDVCIDDTNIDKPVVIADVDRNDHADILVSDSKGIYIFRDGEWAECRPVWNQLTYLPVNVDDNLQIQNSYSPWREIRLYNAWNTQYPVYIKPDCAAMNCTASANPQKIPPGGKSNVTVTAKFICRGATLNNSGISVTLTLIGPGSLNPTSGTTNTAGQVFSTYTAPTQINQTTKISIKIQTSGIPPKCACAEGHKASAMLDSIITIVPPPNQLKVMVINPNGFENWTVGSTHTVSWDISGGVAPYKSKLEYSITGINGPWYLIADNLTVTNYAWQLPNIQSSHTSYVRITVRDNNATTIYDTNDKNFTIWNPGQPPPPHLHVVIINPNGFENWTVNKNYTINWNITGGSPPYNTKLEYSSNGPSGPWFVIATSISNAHYLWTVPDIQTSFNCYIKVTTIDNTSQTTYDIGDANFTIWNPVPPQSYIQGHVKNASNHQPIQDVFLITIPDNYTAKTDSQGFYKMVVASNCNYSVIASKSGYNNQTKSVYVGQGDLVTLDFYLHYAHPNKTYIQGYVKDASNQQPILGVSLITSPGGYNTTTDSQGFYKMQVKPNCNYSVEASKSGYDSQTKNVYVGQGQNVTLNFALQPSGKGWLTGFVTDNVTGGPIPFANITADGKSTLTNSTGCYVLELPTGTYTVKASKPGYYMQTKSAVVYTGQPTVLNFTLTPVSTPVLTTVTIKPSYLSIKVGDNRKLTAQAYDQYGNPIQTATYNDWHVTKSIGKVQPKHGQSTVFTATTVGMGEIRVRVYYEGITKYGSAMINVTAHIDIITITGRVVDSAGKPVVGATVTLNATDGSYNATTTTDTNGMYTFIDVPANKTYIIIINMPGYEDSEVSLSPEQTQSDYQMEPVILKKKGFPWMFIGVIAIIGSIGGALLLSIFASEVAKYAFFALFIPIYTRLRRQQMLDHFIRGEIYGHIKTNPGTHYNRIRKLLNVNNGTLAYHLTTLEKAEFIKSRKDGKFKRFYPGDTPIPIGKGIYLSKLQDEIVTIIKKQPGIKQSVIAKKLNKSRQTINYNIKQLEFMDIIKIENVGRESYCYAK